MLLPSKNKVPTYPTLPYPTLPYPTLPYPALPCPALPCPALPYPTYLLSLINPAVYLLNKSFVGWVIGPIGPTAPE